MAMVPVTSAIAENVQEIEGDVKVIDEPKVFDSSVENSIVGLKEYKDMLLRYKTIIENTDWSVMPPEEALYQLTEMNLDVLRGLQNLLQSNPELLEEIRNVEQTEEFKNTLKEAGLAYTSLEDALTESIQQLESAQGELIPVFQAGMEGPTAMATGIICDILATILFLEGWCIVGPLFLLAYALSLGGPIQKIIGAILYEIGAILTIIILVPQELIYEAICGPNTASSATSEVQLIDLADPITSTTISNWYNNYTSSFRLNIAK